MMTEEERDLKVKLWALSCKGRVHGDRISWDAGQMWLLTRDGKTTLIENRHHVKPVVVKVWEHILSPDEVRAVLETDWSKRGVLAQIIRWMMHWWRGVLR